MQYSTIVLDFIETHAADDILYALTNRSYFGLSDDRLIQLAGYVFESIEKNPLPSRWTADEPNYEVGIGFNE